MSPRRDGHAHSKERGRFSWFLLGAVVGAGAMFLLDPHQGRRRRALVRDKAVRVANTADTLVSEEIPKRVDYFGGFAEGARHRVFEAIQGTEHPAENDQVLIDRVMSTVFRDPGMPKGSVNVDAASGVVYLRGHVDDTSILFDLEQRVRRVDGVRDVINLINRPDADPTEIAQPPPSH
jgi:osmotically-inducible protein OsmY